MVCWVLFYCLYNHTFIEFYFFCEVIFLYVARRTLKQCRLRGKSTMATGNYYRKYPNKNDYLKATGNAFIKETGKEMGKIKKLWKELRIRS